MKTVAVIGQKGGSGKTTLAVHLAVAAEHAGLTAAIIDTDPQATAWKWSERRADDVPQVIREVDPEEVPKLVERARSRGADLLFVDTPGKAEHMALAAADIADLILVPVRPTVYDLDTVGTTHRTVRIAGKVAQTWAVLNQCPSKSAPLQAEARMALQQKGLQSCDHIFHIRKAFFYSGNDGRVAQELEPGGKAADETQLLFEWLSTALELRKPAKKRAIGA